MIRAVPKHEKLPRDAVGSLSTVELDGYLTAILIGPPLIMPSEWLEGLWDDEPVFDDIKDAQAMLDATMSHYNDVLHRLDAQTYLPYGFPDDPTRPDAVAWAIEWVHGFNRGIGFRPDDWMSMMHDEDASWLLAPILAFAEHEEKPLLELPPEELVETRLRSVALIPEAIPVIREYWNADRQEPPPQPRSQRPGRNDPCPCGSGKKYKRCCGSI